MNALLYNVQWGITSCITGMSYDILKVHAPLLNNTIFISIIMYVDVLLKSLLTNISVTNAHVSVSVT